MHHLSLLNKPTTRCSWVVIFISLLDHSTCFGRFLHPSSGVWQLYMQPPVRVTHWTTTFLRGRVWNVHTLPRRKVVVRCVTRTGGCIYSCHTPDDGCKKRPKHVEWSRSEIKVTTQLHRVGLFNNNNKSKGYSWLNFLNVPSSSTKNTTTSWMLWCLPPSSDE